MRSFRSLSDADATDVRGVCSRFASFALATTAAAAARRLSQNPKTSTSNHENRNYALGRKLSFCAPYSTRWNYYNVRRRCRAQFNRLMYALDERNIDVFAMSNYSQRSAHDIRARSGAACKRESRRAQPILRLERAPLCAFPPSPAPPSPSTLGAPAASIVCLCLSPECDSLRRMRSICIRLIFKM